MKKIKFRIFTLLMLIAIGFVIGIGLKQDTNFVKLRVNKWDNIYGEKNIKLYYNNSDKVALSELNKKYEVDKIIGESKDEFDKSIKILNWISSNMKYKSVVKVDVANKGVFDILKDEKKDSYSDEEISIVFNEFALASGIISRIGEFIASNEEKVQGEDSIKICEIWSDKYNKWIVLDPSKNAYFLDKDIPLSAIEIIDRKDLNNIKVVGVKNEGKYKKEIMKYLKAYSIKIDNGVYGITKSNSYICYSKDISIDKIGVNLNIYQPTIFVENGYLFEISPKDEYKIQNNDIKPTVILLNNSQSIKQEGNVKMELVAGVFKNSSMVEKYYISINNEPFEEQSKYFNIKIRPGINNIKLSEDGKSVAREIIMEYLEEN